MQTRKGCIIHLYGEQNPFADWAQICFDGRRLRYNHAIQIWWRSVQRFWVGWGSKFAFSHRLWRSSLQHSHYRDYRVRCDSATYWPKVANFAHPSHLVPSFGVTPSNLRYSFTVPKAKVFQGADGEDLVILACTVFDWSTRVTDGQTDGRTDRRPELRWLRRAESSSCFCA